jgi:tripartite ATP-independent transporter DctP family solute receptor
MLTRRQILLAPLALSACGRRNAGATRPLFAADAHPDEYPTVQALHAIDRLLDERTDGEMRVRVYAGGQMGAEKDTLEITIFGGLDLNRVNLAPLNSIVPQTLVLALPFLFQSIKHLRLTLDGVPGQKILDAMARHGLQGLCYYDSGARSFYNTRRPIHTPADLSGLKIRVQNSDIYVAMVQALGANPTPIPYGEVYQALVQGVVDGAENNWPSYESSRHYEVAQHFSLTRHVMAPEVLVASARSWAKMSAEEQSLLADAARDSVKVMRDIWDQRVADSRKRLLDSGVQLVTDVDHDAFARLMLPVWDRFLLTKEQQQLADDIVSLGEDRA